jgi:hypothetical protein
MITEDVVISLGELSFYGIPRNAIAVHIKLEEQNC